MGMGIKCMGMGVKTWEFEMMPRLDDFADLCDPQEMGRERNELAEYMNLKVGQQRHRPYSVLAG